ncbi:hypothetical protein GB937_010086 [Aspergillus fischeri]|nr:hypothetical protein GB937_010086 [Aspergillus fischeri]
MLSALHAVKEKLSIYYRETDKVHSDLFFFNNKDWGPELHDKYHKSFETYAGVQISKINALFAPDFNQSIFWKEHEHKFPALAKMACDILLIPATSASVKRLFNSA